MKLAIAIGGSSGAIYTKVLLNSLIELQNQLEEVSITASKNAKTNWDLEIGGAYPSDPKWKWYDAQDFNAPFASGSAGYDAMIICPCSAGLLGRIAAGVSGDLSTRGADVMLKERKKLVVILRETPFNLIHIRNMETITLAGGIICPAIPSFYNEPKDTDSIIRTVTDRALQLAGLKVNSFEWGKE